MSTLRRDRDDSLTIRETPPAPTDGDVWRVGTPLLRRGNVVVRGLRREDAPALCALCAAEQVGRFLWPPPATTERFTEFIDWSRDQQTGGLQICFALVAAGDDTAAGLIQVRQLEAHFQTAEWGFVVGQPYWGTGLFSNGAHLVLKYLFETVGVRRLEARTVVTNGRANGALQKLGAVREGVLRQGFSCGDRCLDQYLWSILANDWSSRPADSIPFLH
jgi:ribosomal-protein-alanine N-acetyltransferase